jgi:hypothetical protein
MYIVAIAWIYVALMMGVAEATNSNGTVLGAIVTFVLYGLLPVGLVLYILGTPGRKRLLRARQAQEQAEWAARNAPPQHQDSGAEPDASSHAPADAVTPVRVEM